MEPGMDPYDVLNPHRVSGTCDVQVSYCIPVMGRLEDIKGTLPTYLADHRGMAGLVEFIVIDFDADGATSRWLVSRFAEDIAAGLLRLVQCATLPVWHFGRAKNAFAPYVRGRMMSSLDADNFVTTEQTECLLELAAKTSGYAMVHHFSGQYGDGSSGRLTMPAVVYRQTGYDDLLLPRQFDEMAAILRALKRFPDLPFYRMPGVPDVFTATGALADFHRAEPLPNPRRVLEIPGGPPPLNPRGANYVALDPELRWGDVFNSAQVRWGLAASPTLREDMRLKAVWAGRELVKSVPASRLGELLFDSPPETAPGLTMIALICPRLSFLPRFCSHHLGQGVRRLILLMPPGIERSDLPDLPPEAEVVSCCVGRPETAATLWLEAAFRCAVPEGEWGAITEATELIYLPDKIASLDAMIASIEARGQDRHYALAAHVITEDATCKPTIFKAQGPCPLDYAKFPDVRQDFGRKAEVSWRLDAGHHLFGQSRPVRRLVLWRHRPGVHLVEGRRRVIFADKTCVEPPWNAEHPHIILHDHGIRLSGMDLAEEKANPPKPDLKAQLEALNALAKDGGGALALRQLDELSVTSGISPSKIAATKEVIRHSLREKHQRVDRPADVWMLAAEGARNAALPRLRRLSPVQAKLPRPYPFDMALPREEPLASLAPSPPMEAERHLPPGLPLGLGRVQIILSSDALQVDLNALFAMLARQTLKLPHSVTVFAPGTDGRRVADVDIVPLSICAPEAKGTLDQIAGAADQVLFLEGGTQLDPTALERLCRLASTSARVVQPLVAPLSGQSFRPYALERLIRDFPARLPFRGIRGMNLMLSSRLWSEVGGIAPEFQARSVAAVDLGYRLFVAGAWFVPQQMERIGQSSRIVADEDIARYRARCPNPMDRPSGAGFAVPRVSIYIPAWNAGRFIAEAVQSVLDQDFRDLEVCVHDDGSTDDTREVLERNFAQEPRLRWQSGPNRGIGAASNAAIAMGRSPYIGQLDADDRLLPGAVSRLVERLEADPRLACVYGSCERINAEGGRLHPEYDWPVFSREKLMLTSIVHHFRIFRRQAFARTDGFRTDLRNAVDYDLFLKLSEVGRMEHVPEILYQRRWHGENTSLRHEADQSRNTHLVQRAALSRTGLAHSWELQVPDPQSPRQITYGRQQGAPVLFFWPDYSASNPYQRMFYRPFQAAGADIIAAPPEAVLRALRQGQLNPANVTFHLHWLHYIFVSDADDTAARQAAERLLIALGALRRAGVRVVWTVHNLVSHDSRFPRLELALSRRLADLADLVHLHDAAACVEMNRQINLPEDKVCIARHGSYVGIYPDHVSREDARSLLGIAPLEDVVLFCGAIRPYKGLDALVAAFRQVLVARPKATLIIAGSGTFDPLEALDIPLSAHEEARIRRIAEFVEPGELQVLFRAADVVALPYRSVLTSGSALLAMGFGCPIILPANTAPATSLSALPFVKSYDPAEGVHSLAAEIEKVLSCDPTERAALSDQARDHAMAQRWPDNQDLPLLQEGRDS
jgi:glycosyltransferase involved in cell wall biosynthesis